MKRSNLPLDSVSLDSRLLVYIHVGTEALTGLTITFPLFGIRMDAETLIQTDVFSYDAPDNSNQVDSSECSATKVRKGE